MKMVLIAYSEAADYDLIGAIKAAGVTGYTKFTEVLGEATETEPHMGTQCWPGRNNFLAIAVEDKKVEHLISTVKEMKEKHPKAGVKAFIMPMEGIF